MSEFDSGSQPPRSDISAIKDFYDSIYYSQGSAAGDDALRGHYERLHKRLGVQAGQKVLDVACGTGGWLRVCHDNGAAVSGVDLSEKAIAVCRKSIPNGEFYAQPAEELPFSDGVFDVITCFGSLEHFVDPLASLKEMVRVGKEDAAYLLLVPNKDFLTRRLRLFRGTGQVQAKEIVRTVGEWESLFMDAGLRVERRWKDLHVLNTSWIRRGAWYKWPARAIQALLLTTWPLKWQYQIYFQCASDSKST